LSTGGKYIAKDVKSLWQARLAEGKKENQIGDGCKFVRGEVLMTETPIQLARMASIQHQRK
jgi:hypothetical protein